MEIFKSINNINLSAKVLGKGEPVLCLSGFGSSNYNFELLKDILAQKFQCIMLDNCGTGLSEARENDYTIEQLADDAVNFMNELGFKKFHVIGISMGGFIAQSIACYFPDRITSLSLLCTTSGGHDFTPLPELTEASLISFYELPIEQSSYIGVKSVVSPDLEKTNPKLFSFMVKLRQSHPVLVKTVLQQKRAVDKYLNGKIDLNQIKCPTLILSGDNDRFVSPLNSVQLKKKIKNSKLIFIENSDHLFFFEKYQAVASELKYFINNQIHQIGVHI